MIWDAQLPPPAGAKTGAIGRSTRYRRLGDFTGYSSESALIVT
jgi:hypothetical protein